MGLEQKRIVVENLQSKRRDGVALTAVRKGQLGYVVSTVPFWSEEGVFETGTTELYGYVPQGRDATIDTSWKNGETNIEIYAGDREEALSHHRESVEKVAITLEGKSS